MNKRPVEVLDLTPREHEYPISGQTMRKLLSLYDHPEYMVSKFFTSLQPFHLAFITLFVMASYQPQNHFSAEDNRLVTA